MFEDIIATVVFVRDLAGSTAFYRDTLELLLLEEDATSSTFRLNAGCLILLSAEGAADLLNTDASALRLDGAPRGLLAASVKNVDAAYEELTAKGVSFFRPPTDQPWGLRTAHFADPEGNLWEINQPIAANK
ncbi:glyoxalase/bleomycin resistance protein/dioxygenase superfamily protein [Thermosporothrix hazakensis]|jgi:catechol 2,3-dioxygenase-like lactoylglutathione lyase family enzyme|uniref:Glyoxalase/bleomycin resistance protein/dioxygenase superfamily protein n=2 Tax=Thermosporothrix TaxID=768650 RepID=A0A326U1K1_THEHA|nr:VOC family protein [Thermosporothrix hazakensis]PZW24060.1 glyoxalase/bleomycin resistance protein/dioxygenase superfamily protein [Thermosporothrix hazakensis]BBH87844.1 glyoxalase/bleomycin resistance/dioxygenase family protein [Thermosporothrix sp. COM3]GCE50272.1 glyoxalase/bleomycin resistance/dioxygenase family protein [Thermosporothrix hazakensis]